MKVSFSNCLDWKNRIELSSQFSQRTGQQWPTEGGGGWEVWGATQPQSGEKRQGEATMLEREREREREREGGELISYESDISRKKLRIKW